MEWQRKRKRVFAFGLMICLTAVLLLSTLFIVTHAEHDCIGNDCEICYEIKGCVAAVRHMSEALSGGTSYLLYTWLFLLCPALISAKGGCPAETLVALKIRLDN